MAILKPAGTKFRYVAAALALCAGVATLGHAQTVAGDVTTGAAIPEDQVVSTALPTARSQTVTFGASLGMGETDNVFETPTDKHSQTMALAGIDFGWTRTGSALDANVVGDFNYLDYLQGAYGSQLLGRFDGLTSLSMFSDHLKWFLQDDFGEGQLNPYAPATPTDLEQINVVNTGPQLILRPTDDTTVQLGARYARASYETSPLDGDRTIEDVLVQRLLSGDSSIGLGAELQQLRFDNTIVNTDYDRSRFYFLYDITGARTHISATVGETQANDSGAWIATPLVQLTVTHQLSAQTSLNITGGRDLTDAADTFSSLRSGAAGGIGVAPAAQTSGDYLRNYATAALQLNGQRTAIALTGNWERDTYTVDNTFDVDRFDLELRLNRQLSRILSAGVFATVMQSRYFNEDEGQINSHFLGADITWKAGRTVSVDARYTHAFQDTSGAFYAYAGNTLFVTVTYRPLVQDTLPPQ